MLPEIFLQRGRGGAVYCHHGRGTKKISIRDMMSSNLEVTEVGLMRTLWQCLVTSMLNRCLKIIALFGYGTSIRSHKQIVGIK